MSLSVSKTITMSREDADEFQEWLEKFDERAGHDHEKADRNRSRAMRRKYGYSDFWLTGSNNTFTLNLGHNVD